MRMRHPIVVLRDGDLELVDYENAEVVRRVTLRMDHRMARELALTLWSWLRSTQDDVDVTREAMEGK
jgi:hypothetical protein